MLVTERKASEFRNNDISQDLCRLLKLPPGVVAGTLPQVRHLTGRRFVHCCVKWICYWYARVGCYSFEGRITVAVCGYVYCREKLGCKGSVVALSHAIACAVVRVTTVSCVAGPQTGDGSNSRPCVRVPLASSILTPHALECNKCQRAVLLGPACSMSIAAPYLCIHCQGNVACASLLCVHPANHVPHHLNLNTLLYFPFLDLV